METKIQQVLQSAASYFSGGKLDEAEKLCARVLQQNPDLIDFLHLLALIKKSRGVFAESESLFSRCLELDEKRVDIRSNLGNLYQSYGNYQAARSCYLSALAVDDKFRPARIAFARLCNSEEDFKESEKQASLLLQQNEQDSEALVVLGNSLRGQRRFADAEQAYKNALLNKPNYGAASHNLGALYVQTNRSSEALQQLDKAVSVGVRGSSLLINLATALMSLGKLDEAEAKLANAVAAGNHDSQLLELLTKLRYMAGNENFTRAFEDSIKKNPANSQLRVAYARLLQGAESYEKAEDCLKDFLRIHGPNAAIHCALAATQQSAGRFESALENSKKAEAIAGNNQHSLALSIDALLGLERIEEAQRLIEKGRKQFPLDQWYIAVEAVAARLLGNSKYQQLYDYEQLVREFVLEPPTGWTSIEGFNHDLLQVLKERHRFNTHPLDQSLRHGTQTPTSLLWDNDEVIQHFLECLKKPISQYCELLGYDESHPLRSRNTGRTKLIGCWSVRLQQAGYHVNHVHPEGWLSSAYYVETPAEIETSDSHAGWLQFGESRFPIPGVSAEYFVKPEAGKLALFPSYMWHGTVPLKGTDPRTTIAFDIIPEAD